MSAPEVEALDAEHRARQGVLGLLAAQAVRDLWNSLIDPADVTGTAGRWLRAVLQAITVRYAESAEASLQYNGQVRRIAAPDAPPLQVQLPEPNVNKIRASLIAVGPAALLIRSSKIPAPMPVDDSKFDDTARFALESRSVEAQRFDLWANGARDTAASAAKHVRDGGRDMTDRIVEEDPATIGYARVTQPGCCHWCAMLASRGPTYAKDSFAASDARFTGPGNQKVHDDCNCTLRALQTEDPNEWPEASLAFSDLWADTGAKFSGKRAQIAFRRAYEGRPVDGRRSKVGSRQ